MSKPRNGGATEYFVDYLRLIEEQPDERSEYPGLLDQHAEFIKGGLKRYRDNASTLAKYEWLREYHPCAVKKWEPGKLKR